MQIKNRLQASSNEFCLRIYVIAIVMSVSHNKPTVPIAKQRNATSANDYNQRLLQMEDMRRKLLDCLYEERCSIQEAERRIAMSFSLIPKIAASISHTRQHDYRLFHFVSIVVRNKPQRRYDVTTSSGVR